MNFQRVHHEESNLMDQITLEFEHNNTTRGNPGSLINQFNRFGYMTPRDGERPRQRDGGERPRITSPISSQGAGSLIISRIAKQVVDPAKIYSPLSFRPQLSNPRNIMSQQQAFRGAKLDGVMS